MRIYQTYSTIDMAGSDAFHPTLAEAREHLRAVYGVKGAIKLDAKGSWNGSADDEDGDYIHLESHDIKLTRTGLCTALELIPNR